jgi:hypothetical protein
LHKGGCIQQYGGVKGIKVLHGRMIAACMKLAAWLEAAHEKRTKTPDNSLCHGGDGLVKHQT